MFSSCSSFSLYAPYFRWHGFEKNYKVCGWNIKSFFSNGSCYKCIILTILEFLDDVCLLFLGETCVLVFTCLAYESYGFYSRNFFKRICDKFRSCLLYTSDAADDLLCVDLGGRRIIK